MLASEIKALRDRHYNGTVTLFHRVHDDLAIVRVRPDGQALSFESGQYTVLGLGYWEARIDHTQVEHLENTHESRLIRRSYSISARLLSEHGTLLRADGLPDVEFYVALVRNAATGTPALTPRLFRLDEGSRLHIGPRAHGRYTLAGVKPHEDIVFCATGTGEAPHNAMIAELLSRGHKGMIVSVVCVRCNRDLAYLEKHRRLEQVYQNYRYLPLTTREPENIDAAHDDFRGKLYIQDYFESHAMQTDAGCQFTPESTHFYLCGNPAMIGLTKTDGAGPSADTRTGMVELLERRGFRLDRPHVPGTIHIEQYW